MVETPEDYDFGPAVCKCCEDTYDDQAPFCEGCGYCQECCNCTETDCDCETCEERREKGA